jgi:hypothetical protein
MAADEAELVPPFRNGTSRIPELKHTIELLSVVTS